MDFIIGYVLAPIAVAFTALVMDQQLGDVIAFAVMTIVFIKGERLWYAHRHQSG